MVVGGCIKRLQNMAQCYLFSYSLHIFIVLQSVVNTVNLNVSE